MTISNFNQPHVTSNVPMFITLIDTSGGTVTYTGYAEPGTATSEARWFIVKEDSSGTTVTSLFANGMKDMNQVWDDRTSLPYS